MTDAIAQSFFLALVAIDPISLAPVFAALTAGMTRIEQNVVIIRATIIASIVVAVFFFVGNWILTRMGVSLGSFNIIGGLFLIITAFEMVFQKRMQRRKGTAEAMRSDTSLSSLAVFPIAIPLVVGPATITLAVLGSGKAEQAGWIHASLVTLCPILFVVLLCALSMFVSGIIVRRIGHTIPMILQRIFGLLLGALAIELVIDGIRVTFGLAV